MELKLRYKEGNALAISENGSSRFIKLVLKDEVIEILEKVNPSRQDGTSKHTELLTKNKLATESSFAYSKLPVERTVELIMDATSTNTSLGISIKGGTDFNLPILISKIISGERADKTNQLFVGDAILELNGKSMLGYTHRAAVDALQSAGSHVIIKVRHLPHAATVLLNEGVLKKELSSTDESQESSVKLPLQTSENSAKAKKISLPMMSNHVGKHNDSDGSNENIHKLPTDEYSYLTEKFTNKKLSQDKNTWIVGLRISLQYAYLSVFEYKRVSHQEKYDSFLIKSIDGHSTGIISFKDSNIFHYWKEAIKFNINALLINSINKMNRSMKGDDQIHYMGWLFCIGHSKVEGAYSCKRYYESEYANIEDIKAEIKIPTTQTDNNQCISRKQRSLESSPGNKWCYMFGNNSQKPNLESQQKQKLPNHSQANLSELSLSSLRHTQLFQGTKYSNIDKPLFLILRGIHLYLFVKPPIFLADWFSASVKSVISRTIINQRKVAPTVKISNSCSHEDGLSFKQLAISESSIIQTNNKDKDICPTQFVIQIEQTKFDFLVDCQADLVELETIWVRVNYHAVCHIKVDTFKCSYQNIDCILCLDFDYGIKLLNSTDGIRIWHFKFHQLRASSDDGDNRLRLIFSDDINNQSRIVDQILHCHNLPTLLISIQSFLTAKLGQVDPHYFDR